VALASSVAAEEGLPAEFQELNLYADSEVNDTGRWVASHLTPSVVYARFLVHALENDGRQNLWRLTREMLRGGGRAYLEFRVAVTRHVFGEHYRQFVEPAVVVEEIEQYGGHVEHTEVGHGLAVYQDEDPLVCRLMASWSQA